MTIGGPNNHQRILVLAAHIDDGEFGCGASMSKWVEEGRDVYYVALSSAGKSVPKGMPGDILEKEVRQATKTLGIKPSSVMTFRFPVREFPQHRQEILETLISLGGQLQPQLVLLPSTNDTHQDHQTLSQEGFRAFKKHSIIGYEMPYNNLNFSTDLFVVLAEEHVAKKTAALKCYRSQASRPYATPDFVRSLARVRGVQVGTQYAEAFQVVRWIIS